MSKTYIGIDYSINSPGIVLFKESEKKYQWYGYYKPGKCTKKEERYLEELNQFDNVHINVQQKFEIDKNDYSKGEFDKFKRGVTQSNWIWTNIIFNNISTSHPDDVSVAFEGFSYGSSTNNIIDIIISTTLLKRHFDDKGIKIETYAPTAIKKFAGKGNMGKLEVFKKFKQNILNDDILKQDPLWNWIVQNIEVEKKVPSVIDDLIDAYFVNNYLRSLNL